LILILGGARSGKSTTAERIARDLGGDDVLYVATAEAWDDEMRARIAEHRRARPANWRTLEAPFNVADRLREVEIPGVLLLDCITLLASNALLTLPEDCAQETAIKVVLGEIEPLLLLFQAGHATWIVVSNEVGMGIVPPYRLGRLFRDALGLANQRLAQAADEVVLMVAGLPWHMKRP
jgi:adenosylcobinamide kinase/adenosylcobinamide-phosphate guanylyltransferase